MIDPNLKCFKCRNRQCAKEIAHTDGGRLYVGKLAIISEQVIYSCAHCDYYSRWIRLDDPKGELSDTLETLPSPYQDDPNLEPFNCPCCQEAVALAYQNRLYVSGMVISTRIVYLCLHCGKSSVWKPAIRPLVNSTSIK